MHEEMSSAGGVVLTCMLVVGIAGAVFVRAWSATVRRIAPDRIDPCAVGLAWSPDPFDAPARASPAWLQRYRR